jgi:hypothetical protein
MTGDNMLSLFVLIVVWFVGFVEQYHIWIIGIFVVWQVLSAIDRVASEVNYLRCEIGQRKF